MHMDEHTQETFRTMGRGVLLLNVLAASILFWAWAWSKVFP
jgi:hypothetical protein